jgi:hypothetical protein
MEGSVPKTSEEVTAHRNPMKAQYDTTGSTHSEHEALSFARL